MAYPERIKNKKVVSFFSYEDINGKQQFLTALDEDREFHIFHKTKHRHWSFTAPAVNFPFRQNGILDSGNDVPVLIVPDEVVVEQLVKLGFVATTARACDSRPANWAAWTHLFVDRKVVILPRSTFLDENNATSIRQHLKEVAKTCVVVYLPKIDQGEDVAAWLEKNKFGKLELQTLIEVELEKNAPAPGATLQDVDIFTGQSDADEADPSKTEKEESWDSSWKAFPVDQLPVEVADYIQEGARLLNCDPAYLALASLVTLGGAVGNSRVCRLNGEWIEPSVFWGCLIAENSTLKSPASDKATEPIEELEDGFAEEFSRELEAFEFQMEVIRTSGKSAKAEGDRDGSLPLLKLPVAKRFKVDDITVEKLGEILYDNSKGLVCIRDELAGWFGSFTRYKAAGIGGTDMPFWLEVFRARSRTVDRKGGNRPSIRIKRAAVSVYGTIQPETIGAIFNDAFFSSGFVARILFTMPPKPRKVFVEGSIDAAVRFSYKEMFRGLYFLDGDLTFKRDRGIKFVDFTPEGIEAWRRFHKEWSERQYVSFGEIGSSLAKLEAYCARFAMLFALCDFVSKRAVCEEITAEHVGRAFAMVNWFAVEAERVYSLIRTPATELKTDRIVELIRRHDGKITPRRLLQSNQSRYKNTAKAREILDGMVNAGVLSLENHLPGCTGGRATTVYTLRD